MRLADRKKATDLIAELENRGRHAHVRRIRHLLETGTSQD